MRVVCPQIVDILCHLRLPMAVPVMHEMGQLRQQLTRDVFDYQQLVACLARFRKPRDKIRRLLSRGDLIRVKKGLYAFAEPYRTAPLSREWLANWIYGPSSVRLDYALSDRGLIPERVGKGTFVAGGRPPMLRAAVGGADAPWREVGGVRLRRGSAADRMGGTSARASCGRVAAWRVAARVPPGAPAGR